MAMGGNAMRSPHRHYLDWIATVGLSIDGRGECGGKVRRGRRIFSKMAKAILYPALLAVSITF